MASDGWGGQVDGKWKDSLPVLPDRVTDKIQDGKPVSVEEVMGESAVAAIHEEQAKRSEPVHAEDLTAVRKSDPRIAGATSFDGSTLPSVPVRKRVIPAPFQRPRIGLREGHGRSWQQVRAGDVQAGDMVVDLGLVTSRDSEVRYETRAQVLGQHPKEIQPGELLLATSPSLTTEIPAPDTPVAVGTDILLRNAEGAELRVDAERRLRVFAAEGTGEPDQRAARTF